MKVTKRVHTGYKEYYENNLKSLGIRPWFGKWQYLFENDKGNKAISLIELKDYFHDGKDIWEIYCIKGGFFEDVKRFITKETAIEKIKSYLE